MFTKKKKKKEGTKRKKEEGWEKSIRSVSGDLTRGRKAVEEARVYWGVNWKSLVGKPVPKRADSAARTQRGGVAGFLLGHQPAPKYRHGSVILVKDTWP